MYATTVPAPETDRIVALTPKGESVRAAYRLLAALRQLDSQTRAAVLALLAEEMAELLTTA